MPNKIKSSDIDNIIQLAKSGVTAPEICEIFCISRTSISRLLSKHGVSTKDARFKSFTEAQKIAIVAAFKSGVGIAGIGNSIGFHVPVTAAKRILCEFGLNPRNRSEQQKARMDASSESEKARLVASANAAARGRTRAISEKAKRAKTMEGFINPRSKWEKLVFDFVSREFNEAIPSKAIGIYNADICIGNVTVEVFGGGWSYSDVSRVSKYIERTKKIGKLGYHVIFVIFTGKPNDVFDGDNLIRQIKLASCDPSPTGKYRMIWGNFNAASGSCLDINHDAFVCPFVNVRDITTGRYNRVPR